MIIDFNNKNTGGESEATINGLLDRSLTAITVSSAVTSIGNYALAGCTSLTDITFKATTPPTISNTALQDVTMSQVTVTVPEGSKEAYKEVEALSGSTIVDGAGGKVTLTFSDGSTRVDKYADGIIPSRAYRENGDIVTIDIKDITSIGSDAFNYCTGATTVTMDDTVTYLGAAAFYDCPALTSITLSNNITEISDGMLYNTHIIELNIPSGVTLIRGWGVHCNGFLSSVTFNSVTAPEVQEYGLDGLASTGTLYLPANYSGYDSIISQHFSGWTIVTIPTVTLTYSDGSTYTANVPDGIFNWDMLKDAPKNDDDKSATGITFANVKYINKGETYEHNASLGFYWLNFNFGETMYEINSHIYAGNCTTFTIPDTVTTIANEGLRLNGVTDVIIGTGITNMGYNTIYECGTCTSITFNSPNCPYGSDNIFGMYLGQNGNIVLPTDYKPYWNYVVNRFNSIAESGTWTINGGAVPSITDGTVSVTYNDGTYSALTIANGNLTNSYGLYWNNNVSDIDILDGIGCISDYACQGCSVTSLTIPDSVSSIGKYAFNGCSQLVDIEFDSKTPPILNDGSFTDIPSTGTLHLPTGYSGYDSIISQYFSGWTIETFGGTTTLTVLTNDYDKSKLNNNNLYLDIASSSSLIPPPMFDLGNGEDTIELVYNGEDDISMDITYDDISTHIKYKQSTGKYYDEVDNETTNPTTYVTLSTVVINSVTYVKMAFAYPSGWSISDIQCIGDGVWYIEA